METAATSQPRSVVTVDSRRLTAVVYADMAGYSRLIGEDDAGTCARIAELRADLLDPALARHGGQLVHTAGDSFLVLFDSILSAMRFAIEVQRAMPSFDGDYAPESSQARRYDISMALPAALIDPTSAINSSSRTFPGPRRTISPKSTCSDIRAFRLAIWHGLPVTSVRCEAIYPRNRLYRAPSSCPAADASFAFRGADRLNATVR